MGAKAKAWRHQGNEAWWSMPGERLLDTQEERTLVTYPCRCGGTHTLGVWVPDRRDPSYRMFEADCSMIDYTEVFTLAGIQVTMGGR